MLFGHAPHPNLSTRLLMFVPTLTLCSACSSDPETPLGGSGGQPAAGSGGAAATMTAGNAAMGGSFSGTGAAGLPSFGTAGTTAVGGGGASSVAGSGGTGGTGGTAGGTDAGGSGGGQTLGCAKSTGADPLIDDFEDGDTTLKLVDGRNGPWETFDDGSTGALYTTKTPTAAMGRAGTSGFCTSISGYKAWGANLVATMASPKCGYDASAYDGVCFWAKGEVTAGGPFVFAVGTSDTVPENSGGMCTQQGRCNAHYEANPVLQKADYKQYCYKWAALKSPNIPNPPTFSKGAIVQIEWKFPASSSKSTDGSFCLDDVSFCKGDACEPK
jgi:hypothetical protein